MAKLGFIVSFFGNALLKAVQPDRKKKMKTFSIWEPHAGQPKENLLQLFGEHQELLKAQITAVEPFAQQGVVISSPANKNIVYRLATAFEVIITHEMRHFEQALQVQKLLETPSENDTTTE